MKDSLQCDPSDVDKQIVVTVVMLLSVWLFILLVVFALAFLGYHRRLNFPEPTDRSTAAELKGFAASTLPKFFAHVRDFISSAKTRRAASQARQFMRSAGSERVQELMQESGFKEEILLESLTIWFELKKYVCVSKLPTTFADITVVEKMKHPFPWQWSSVKAVPKTGRWCRMPTPPCLKKAM
jgi:hypothetical protein